MMELGKARELAKELKGRIYPQPGKVAVIRVLVDTVSKGGIHIADNAKGAPTRGIVVDVGEPKLLPGGHYESKMIGSNVEISSELSDSGLRPGDVIYFEQTAGREIFVDPHRIMVLDYSEVLAYDEALTMEAKLEEPTNANS